jgi:hypothetical protein
MTHLRMGDTAPAVEEARHCSPQRCPYATAQANVRVTEEAVKMTHPEVVVTMGGLLRSGMSG